MAISVSWPPDPGGSGFAFHKLVQNIDNVHVLGPQTNLPVKDPSWVHRVFRYTHYEGWARKIRNILHHLDAWITPFMWRFRNFYSLPSLIICTPIMSSGTCALLHKLIFRVPYIVQVHGEDLLNPFIDTRHFRLRMHLSKKILRNASAIICNCMNTYNICRNMYNIDCTKLHIIYPCIDVLERNMIDYEYITHLKLNVFFGKRIILMVGRLSQRRKGFDYGIKVFSRILKQFPDTTLVIVGPGDQTELSYLTKTLKIDKHVRFMGSVSRYELIHLYSACDLLLLPTRKVGSDIEGFGIVFLEANLMGKPVVAGTSGGEPEAVLNGITGLLVDGSDLDDICSAVSILLNDPDYATRLGNQGYNRVLRDFDSRKCALYLNELISSIIHNQ